MVCVHSVLQGKNNMHLGRQMDILTQYLEPLPFPRGLKHPIEKRGKEQFDVGENKQTHSVRAQRLTNIEILVLIRSLKSSNIEFG